VLFANADVQLGAAAKTVITDTDAGDVIVKLPSVNAAFVNEPYLFINDGANTLTVEKFPSDPANVIANTVDSIDIAPNETATLILATRPGSPQPSPVWMVEANGNLPGIFVLKAGDTMTGTLIMDNANVQLDGGDVLLNSGGDVQLDGGDVQLDGGNVQLDGGDIRNVGTNDLIVRSVDSAAGDPGDVEIIGGDATGAGNVNEGGDVFIRLGEGSPADATNPGGSGGDFRVLQGVGGSGSATQPGGAGAIVAIRAGFGGADGGAGAGNGGNASLTGGDGEQGGNVTVNAGSAFGGTGNGGNASLLGGQSSGGTGGSAQVVAGSALFGPSGVGGDVTIESGPGLTAGGNLLVRAQSGNGANAPGGTTRIEGGAGDVAGDAPNGGVIELVGAQTAGGDVNIDGGSVFQAAILPGDVAITGGEAQAGNSANGGDVTIDGGPSDAAVDGLVKIATLQGQAIIGRLNAGDTGVGDPDGVIQFPGGFQITTTDDFYSEDAAARGAFWVRRGGAAGSDLAGCVLQVREVGGSVGYRWGTVAQQQPRGMLRYDGIVAATRISTTLTNQNQWYGITGLSGAGLADDMTFTVDAANGDYLTVPVSGTYDLDVSWDFEDGANEDLQGGVFVNAEANPRSAIERRLGAGGDIGSSGDTDILQLSADDQIRFKARCITNAGVTLDTAKLKVRLRRAFRSN
jgi:hypothetical protein